MKTFTWYLELFSFLLRIGFMENVECGGTVFLSHDRPNSTFTVNRPPPPSDERSDAHEDCIWYIRAPPSTTIILDVLDLDANVDSFSVFDGLGSANKSENIIKIYRHGQYASSSRAITCQLSVLNALVWNGEALVEIRATFKGITYLEIIGITEINPPFWGRRYGL